MRYMKLEKNKISQFFDSLHFFGTVFAPVKVNGRVSFRKASDFSEVVLEYTRTQMPPKHVLLPKEEPILRFKGEDYEEILEGEERVLFGVHPCDVIALKKLSEVYLQPPEDRYYQERLKRTTIIGLSCVPDESCFCRAFGSFYASDGFDVFLHDCNEFYFARVATPKGMKIVESCKDLFEEVTGEDVRIFVRAEEERAAKVKAEELWMAGDLVEMNDDEFWRRISEKCLNCGTCNIVCPTCQCFEVYDKLSDDLESGERFRRWDSCMLRSHGLVAGGHNFRGTTEERMRNRMSCKLGEMRCVGCGRCTVYCPAGIDILEIARALKGEWS